MNIQQYVYLALTLGNLWYLIIALLCVFLVGFILGIALHRAARMGVLKTLWEEE